MRTQPVADFEHGGREATNQEMKEASRSWKKATKLILSYRFQKGQCLAFILVSPSWTSSL